jgi:ATP-dependent RNA helicase DDX56/DBP9
VKAEATTLAVHCASNIRATVLAGDGNQRSKEIAVANSGQIVIATPGRLAKALSSGLLASSHLVASLKVRQW